MLYTLQQESQFVLTSGGPNTFFAIRVPHSIWKLSFGFSANFTPASNTEVFERVEGTSVNYDITSLLDVAATTGNFVAEPFNGNILRLRLQANGASDTTWFITIIWTLNPME